MSVYYTASEVTPIYLTFVNVCSPGLGTLLSQVSPNPLLDCGVCRADSRPVAPISALHPLPVCHFLPPPVPVPWRPHSEEGEEAEG